MKIKDIEQIYRFSKILNHKNQIDDLVETPLIDVCKYLYDLNVPTTMTSANVKNNKKQAYITIDYDLLSDENKLIIDELKQRYPNNFQLGNFSTLNEHNEVNICVTIDMNTDIHVVQDFFWTIVKMFKMQDVYSFIDADTFLKNVYSIQDIFYRYLVCEKNDFAQAKFIESKEIEDFLIDMGYIKVNSSEFNGGKNIYNGLCQHLWFDNSIDRTFLSDYYIYDTINRNKEILFNGRTIKKENINFNEILRVLNKQAYHYYGEQFIFNPEDQRFYLNIELLGKHNRYLQYQQDLINKRNNQKK